MTLPYSRSWYVKAAVAGFVLFGAGVLALESLTPRLMDRVVTLAAQHGVQLTLSEPPRLDFSGIRLGPLSLEVDGVQAKIDILHVRPSLRALLLAGELRPGSLDAEGVHLEGPEQLSLDLTRLEGTVDGPHLSGEAELRAGGVIAFTALRADGQTRLVATLSDAMLAAQRADLDLQTHLSGVITLDRHDGETHIGLGLSATDLALSAPSLADDTVGPWALSLNASVRLAPEAIQLLAARVSLGSVGADLAGELRSDGDFRAGMRLDDASVDDLLAALPASLAPPPQAPRPEGQLSARLELTGKRDDPSTWQLTGGLDTHAITAHAPALAGTFMHEVTDEDGVEHSFLVGPENPDFVPIAELPTYVPRAITTSEDGGFFAHQGFDLDEVLKSAMAVVAAGRAVRGGSTISQQLAKNLYLSREKTYARKVREALVTLGLEASLPKARLLEIYLNVIEWGPGIYGIEAAAREYFGKDARELTPKEAVYLASIIPNPRRYYTYFAHNELSPAWNARLEDLLAKMAEAGSLTPEAYAQAMAAPVVFSAD